MFIRRNLIAWIFGGAFILAVLPLHLIYADSWSPFLPITVHFYLLAAIAPKWSLFLVIPGFYVIQTLLLEYRLAGIRWLSFLAGTLLLLDIYYFVTGFSYAIKWQSLSYFVTVAIINTAAFSLIIWLLLKAKEEGGNFLFAANFFIFAFLATYLFPWFGEIA